MIFSADSEAATTSKKDIIAMATRLSISSKVLHLLKRKSYIP
jgi:hypothetical protein